MAMLGAQREENGLRRYQEKIDIPTLLKMRAEWSSVERSSTDRLKLVNASIRHECKKEMTILQCVRPHKLPVLNYAIMERVGRAHRASQRERAKPELVRSRRFPRSAPTVAVDPRAYATVGPEGDLVLRRVVGHQHLVVTARNLTNCQEVPPRPTAAFCDGAGVRTLQAIASSAANNGQHNQALFTRRAKHIRDGEARNGQ
jgi:hypothetical protein